MLAIQPILDYSGLTESELARYAALCRKGDEDSLLRAGSIFPAAKSDAATIRRVLGLLASRPDVRAAAKRVAEADRELAKLDDEIGRLQQRQAELRAQRSTDANAAAAENNLRTRLGFECDNAAVRLACRDEIKQALGG